MKIGLTVGCLLLLPACNLLMGVEEKDARCRIIGGKPAATTPVDEARWFQENCVCDEILRITLEHTFGMAKSGDACVSPGSKRAETMAAEMERREQRNKEEERQRPEREAKQRAARAEAAKHARERAWAERKRELKEVIRDCYERSLPCAADTEETLRQETREYQAGRWTP